jgi:IS30 family transposase
MYSDATKVNIESLFNQGLSGRKIAEALNLSKSGVNV